jgi:hypothetical protein
MHLGQRFPIVEDKRIDALTALTATCPYCPACWAERAAVMSRSLMGATVADWNRATADRRLQKGRSPNAACVREPIRAVQHRDANAIAFREQAVSERTRDPHTTFGIRGALATVRLCGAQFFNRKVLGLSQGGASSGFETPP